MVLLPVLSDLHIVVVDLNMVVGGLHIVVVGLYMVVVDLYMVVGGLAGAPPDTLSHSDLFPWIALLQPHTHQEVFLKAQVSRG